MTDQHAYIIKKSVETATKILHKINYIFQFKTEQVDFVKYGGICGLFVAYPGERGGVMISKSVYLHLVLCSERAVVEALGFLKSLSTSLNPNELQKKTSGEWKVVELFETLQQNFEKELHEMGTGTGWHYWVYTNGLIQ